MRFLLYQKSVLDNGLRIITGAMPHTRAVCINIFISAGSRYEGEEEAGTSHFIEHLCFKGTERRATAREIAEAIEGVGGILNGGTDREFTVYWCKVARSHFPLALDLTVDMIRHSRFDAQDMERERSIIIEEISDSVDSPQHRASLLIDEVIWPNQPLGRDIAGSKEKVGALSREMLLGYLSRQYVPNNTVVSVAGDIGHEEVLSRLVEVLGDWAVATPYSPYPTEDHQQEAHMRIEQRDTEQAHIYLAVRGIPVAHPDRFNLDLLNVILGEGMSSRLYQEIRERRGLAYDIHSYVDHFLDSGALAIYAGVAPKNVADTVAVMIEVLSCLKEGVPALELTKAKELAKGRLLLRMEDSRSVAGWLGSQELLTRQIRTVDEVASIIDAITSQDLKRVANQLLLTEKLNLAIVGSVAGEDRLNSLLRL